MERLQRAAIVVALRDRMQLHGSWCGETHLQKATYILQEAQNLPLGYSFILYKHGPFSFDLREDIASMRADGVLERRPEPYPYGPKYGAGPYAERLLARHSRLLDDVDDAIEKSARFVGSRGVFDLERLASALLLIRHAHQTDEERLAGELHELKPHVTVEAALDGVRTMQRFLSTAGSDNKPMRTGQPA